MVTHDDDFLVLFAGKFIDVKRPMGHSCTVHSCAQVLQKYRPSRTSSIIDGSSQPHLGHSGRLKPATTEARADFSMASRRT
jgi:hypothetical protein